MEGLAQTDAEGETVLPLETQSVQSVSLLVLSLEQAEVSLPLVPDDFAAGETSDGNDHNAAVLQGQTF